MQVKQEEEDPLPRFWATDSLSIRTTRQFSLLRGKPIKAAADILHAENDRLRRKFSEDSGLPLSPPPEEENGAPVAKQQSISTPKQSPPVNAPSYGGNAKVQYQWNWPLGVARIMNTDDRFEVRVPIAPFQECELWATVVGSELTIRLDATERDDQDRSPGRGRYFLRKYTLPLNVYPQTAEFKMANKSTFRLSLEKDRPLKLAVASYGTDEDSSE